MRRGPLLVVAAVGVVAVVGTTVFIIGGPSPTADCGLGMGGVTPVEEVNGAIFVARYGSC